MSPLAGGVRIIDLFSLPSARVFSLFTQAKVQQSDARKQ
jgi:hypothetical protein